MAKIRLTLNYNPEGKLEIIRQIEEKTRELRSLINEFQVVEDEIEVRDILIGNDQ